MKIFATLMLLTTAAAAHADVTMINDSTLYYLGPDSDDYMITLNVKKQVSLPSGLTDTQKASIMALLDQNSSIKEDNGLLKEIEPTSYTYDEVKPMTDTLRRELEKQNKNGRFPESNFIAAEYVKPMPGVDGVVVLSCDHYMYHGGAHGACMSSFINYSLSKNRNLTLSDLIDIDKPQVAEALQKELTKLYNIIYEDWAEDIVYCDTNLLHVPDCFYLTDKGITFVYQEYEIGPYALGHPEFEVPYLTLLLINKK